MSKTVKILFVDDESARFKVMEDCRKTGKLNADVVDCTQPIIDIDWDNRDSVEIKNSITESVLQIMTENGSPDTAWLVMLDFQLYSRLADYENRNAIIRQAVLDAIWQNENAYLILCTSIAPELCSDFFDDVCYDMAERGAETKFKLYHWILIIFYNGNPANYEFVLKTEINRAIDSIVEGATNDEKWIYV